MRDIGKPMIVTRTPRNFMEKKKKEIWIVNPMLPTMAKKLAIIEIPHEEANFKLCKIEEVSSMFCIPEYI